MTNKTVQKNLTAYIEAENRLMKSLEKLKNFGDECSCEGDNTIVSIIYEGEWKEIKVYCCECGGLMEEM